VTRETSKSVKSQKKKKWISSDQTLATIREKREAKGKDKNRYQELKLMCRVSSKRINSSMPGWNWRACAWNWKQRSNSKGNSRQLFQIVKSMTRKFQPEAAQGYCEDM